MYGLVILYANAAIFHVTKKLGLVVDSSMEAEGVATSKIAEQISYVREILRAFGVPQQGPTFIGTDNTANQRVASGAAVPSRSKHFLRPVPCPAAACALAGDHDRPCSRSRHACRFLN